MNNSNDFPGESSDSDYFAGIDKQIDEATADTGTGNYYDALNKLKKALEMAQGFFGNQMELENLKKEISEVESMIVAGKTGLKRDGE